MKNSVVRFVTVVGARPQFVKAAAVSRAITGYNAAESSRRRIDEIIVHTGQHYDANMSAVFFDELEIPEPRYNLGVGSGPQGRQTGAMLEKIEQVLLDEKPDGVLIYGDTNSTLAGALAAVKLHIPVAHVEAGLRSFNRRMPEEINRIVSDRASSILFCPTRTAVENLAREGITRGVHEVGDVMYDSVLFHAEMAARRSRILFTLSLAPKTYCLATVHRAENTDDRGRLREILAGLGGIKELVIVPLHPRTRRILESEAFELAGNIRVIDPVSYFDMLILEQNARIILTDSGGMQKEACFLAVPCITLRDETEWMESVNAGSNFLAGCERGRVAEGVAWAAAWTPPSGGKSFYGDGSASRAIVTILTSYDGERREQEHIERAT
jgi:UDP-GlcNAc3NAcA epimerase